MQLTVGILCSGALGSSTVSRLSDKFMPSFILTDKGSADIIALAHANRVPLFVGNPRQGKAIEFLRGYPVDVLFSVNYLFIVERDVLSHPSRYAINLHGSLLPKYRGRTPHVWAIINGEKETGVAAHLMGPVCDAGDTVEQIRIPISESDTGASILDRFSRVYPEIICSLLQRVESGELARVKQDENQATYFGKRTPDDGKIDWNWQRERIHNWVRAQADPYPGAFTYLSGMKVIIDQIGFSSKGFSWDMPNGLVVGTEPEPLVKTPNGIVALRKIRNGKSDLFVEGQRLE